MRTTWWTWIGILVLGLIGCGASRGSSSEAEGERSGDPAEGERSGDPAEAESESERETEPATPVDPATIPDYLDGFGDARSGASAAA